jgi:rubredoxin-NAD+ reductase
VDPNPLPLAAIAPPALSQGLAAALTARGITLRLATTASQINKAIDGLEVHLADHSMVKADLVLSAVGLRPELTVAKAGNLATGRGILVDAFGQTSVRDIYALGDCAEYTCELDGGTRTLPYIAPLMTAARAIARTLSGTATMIDLKPAPVIVKTPCYLMALVPPPLHAIASGEWRSASYDGTIVSRFYDEHGIMVGFGVAPHEPNIRQKLLAELGMKCASELPARSV